LAASTIVFQPLGNGLCLAEVLEHFPAFTDLPQHRPQLQANVDVLLQDRLAFRQ